MFNVTFEGFPEVIGLLGRLPSNIRKRIYRKAAQQVVRSGRKRIDTQTDLDGNRFAPRADGSKEPTLKGKRGGKPGIRKLLKVLEATDSGAEVGWNNPFFSNLAAKHQFGFEEATKARKSKKSKVDYSAPANRQQASALINAGYKVRRQGGKGAWKTPTMRWITENLTYGRAGLILRILKGPKVSDGMTTIPARSFLGITEEDMAELRDLLEAEARAALNDK
ncbi:hypothetical protein A1507_05765 [Methylomonas koyamae]|uniref:Virion morphogenesis protein n=1 Tax=Methylomonas koyamae TaxID=702114 RepID=A0A177NRK4_9GAMM|nr:phage virion morphogenesis protein [Methylomonas koyamae]OAI19859.1 hypothetical protein A1507_05765 [Methylomonas koyamae]